MQASPWPFADDASAAHGATSGDGQHWKSPVPPECSVATLRVAGQTVRAELQDVSVNGITMTIDPDHISRLRLGVPWELTTPIERCEVLAQWVYCGSERQCMVGVKRLHELTLVRRGTWFGRRLPLRRLKNSWLLFGLLAVLLFVSESRGELGVGEWFSQMLRDYLPKLARR